MSEQLASEVAELPIGVTTMAAAFRRTVERRPDHTAIRGAGGAWTVTYARLRDRVDAVAGGLAGLGVHPGDTVALLVANRPEFNVCDLAVMTLGATPVSIYPTLTADQMAYVVGDTGARIAIVDPTLLDVLLRAKEQLPALETVVVADGEAAGDGLLSLEEVERAGAGFDGATRAAEVKPEDLGTLIYTSGTTGPPKGVELTQRNIMAGVRALHDRIGFPDEGTRVVSWLPPAHIGERMAHHYLPIALGGQITCCPNPREIMRFLPDARPSWFFSFPRIWEKMKASAEAGFLQGGEEHAARARRALADAREKVRFEQRGEAVPAALTERVADADPGMFAPLRKSLGLDEARALHSGAAPTSADLVEFFNAIGLPLGELWGLSESTGLATVCPPDNVRIGTVGPALAGVELRIADDGEMLVRGELVMRGYRNRPDQTREAIDADGWLHSGDIGAFDDHGYLRIVDRKKEIMISAGGKNMSPANIEAAVKSEDPLIGQAVAIGDLRPFVTALVVLDPDYAAQWAASRGIDFSSVDAPAEHPAVHQAVGEAVDRANAHLARVEQVKRFHILPVEWLPGGEELTPTMKLKRKPIAAMYAEQIEAMYARVS